LWSVTCLVGNKIDAGKREVESKEAISLAREFKMDYIETSALTGEHVDVTFRRVILYVASLLPAVKTHLEVTNLPDGWLLSSAHNSGSADDSSADRTFSLDVRNNNNISDSAAMDPMAMQMSASLPTNKMMHPKQQRRSITSNTSMLKNGENGRDSPQPSPRAASAETVNTINTYINFWTAEETNEKPSGPAPIPLLFDTLAEDKKIEMESRYSSVNCNAFECNFLVLMFLACRLSERASMDQAPTRSMSKSTAASSSTMASSSTTYSAPPPVIPSKPARGSANVAPQIKTTKSVDIQQRDSSVTNKRSLSNNCFCVVM
jgi:hypothetical protein